MHKIKKRKGYSMEENLKKKMYGFYWSPQGIQLWHAPDRDKGLPENRMERGKALFNNHMEMWNNARALIIPIREMLIKHEPELADYMPMPYAHTPEYQEMKDRVTVHNGKLWGQLYGFYFDNAKGLWLWIDSENMSKEDIVEALTVLMEGNDLCLKMIRELLADMSPQFRNALIQSRMYPEYEMWSEKEFSMMVQLNREPCGFCWGVESQYAYIMLPAMDSKLISEMTKKVSILHFVISRAIVELRPDLDRDMVIPVIDEPIETTIKSEARWGTHNGFYYSPSEGLSIWTASLDVETLSAMLAAVNEIVVAMREKLVGLYPAIDELLPESTKAADTTKEVYRGTC